LCASGRNGAAPAISGAVRSLPLLGALAPVRAQDQIEQQEPTPSAVEQVATPIERSFVPAPAPQPFVLLPELRERLKDAPAFFPTGPWLRPPYGHVEQYQGPKNAMTEYRLHVRYDLSVLCAGHASATL